jgi:eukaryotic-like serine/threonine-protein kinase
MTLDPGTRFGSYEILAQIGSGGMGQVHLAQDSRLRRKVALKVLSAEFAGHKDRLRRFIREAEAAASLSHPNAAHIYEVNRIGGINFIAMEYVEGETLRHRMAHTRLRPSEVVDVAIQVASALVAAHHAGIVHRDIKPENIMLRPDGYVKVLDFGLAKLIEEQPPSSDTEAPTIAKLETDPGKVMGTVSYMSPEQARGIQVDARSDVFSLGVVIYEMVAGQRPFQGETSTDLFVSILTTEPVSIVKHSPDVPAELQRIVSKALRKDREERYQTAKDLLIDLRTLKQELEFELKLRHSSSLEVSSAVAAASGSERIALTVKAPSIGTVEAAARTVSSAEYLISEIKSHKKAAILAFVTITIAVAGVTFGVVKLVGKKSSSRFQAMEISRLTSTGKALWTSLSISPDGKYVAYVIDDDRRQSLWVKHVATTSNIQIVPSAEVDYRGLTFSRDGNYIYYASSNKNDPVGSLYQVPVLGGAARKILDGIDGPVTFSPDGKQLAFVREYLSKAERALIVANMDGTGERLLATRKNPDYFVRRGPAWSPDGKVIACPAGSNIGSYQNVVGVQVEGGLEKPISTHRFVEVGQVAWLADGSGLLMTASERRPSPCQVYYLSYPDGELQKVTSDLNNYYAVSLTTDLNQLVAVQNEVPSRIWVAPNGDASRARQITSGKLDGADGLCWTTDNRIIYQSTAGGSFDLWIMDADGANQKQLTVPSVVEGSSSNAASSSPSVSPDGRYVVFTANRTGNFDIWRMDISNGNFRQLTNEGGVYNPQCSPDGLWVVYTSNSSLKDGLFKVGLDGSGSVQLSDKPSPRPAVSPDGKLVACYYGDEVSNTSWKIAIIPMKGGLPTKLLELPATVSLDAPMRWTPGGRAIAYVDNRNGVSNIWSHPLDGGPPKQLTYFNADRIFRFDWSPDGKQLACSRGNEVSDIVLMINSK